MFKDEIKFLFVDIEKYHGDEEIVDLNQRIPDKYIGAFDAVLDLGTSEHIFNYPQVLMNCHLLSKDGGLIYHDVPLNWPNHGFYNLSPTIFYDFYSDNSCTPIECSAVHINRESGGVSIQVIEKIPHWERFSLQGMNGAELNICYLVRKDNSVIDFIFPIQRKYRNPKSWV